MSSNPFSEFFEGLEVDTTPRTAAEWAMMAPEERMGKFFLANVEDENLLNAFRRDAFKKLGGCFSGELQAFSGLVINVLILLGGNSGHV